MSIVFHKETRTFHLYNDSISYIFRVMENDQLEHLYYGRQVRLGHNESPCIVLNLDGYYEPLRAMLDRMVQEGFLDRESREKFLFAADTEEIGRILG